MSLEIHRNPAPSRLPDACTLMEESLGFALGGSTSIDAFVSSEGPENFRVAVDPRSSRPGGVVGVLTCQRAGQYFGAVALPMGAIRCVGVAPEARGRGVLRALLGDTLHELHDDGVILSSLFASSPRVYRSFGYEQAGARISRSAPVSDFSPVPRSGAPLDTRMLGRESEERIRALYDHVAPRRPGFVARTPWWWWRLESRPADALSTRYYGVFRGDELEGYALIKQFGGTRARLLLTEVVAETSDAVESVVALVHAHRTIFHEVDWVSGAADPLGLHLGTPSNAVGTLANRYGGPLDSWMLRILRPQAALTTRTYASGLAVTIRFRIEDRLFAQNNTAVELRVSGGEARIVSIDRADMIVNVRALASLFGAYHPVGALACAGLVRGGTPDERAALASVFAGSPAWMPDHF